MAETVLGSDPGMDQAEIWEGIQVKDLEQRIAAMVNKYLPDAPDADKVQMAAFLACECWNLINEAVHDLNKEYQRIVRKKGGTREAREN